MARQNNMYDLESYKRLLIYIYHSRRYFIDTFHKVTSEEKKLLSSTWKSYQRYEAVLQVYTYIVLQMYWSRRQRAY